MNEIALFDNPLPGMSYDALYRATWEQVKKDFAHFCTPPEIDGAPRPDTMHAAIVDMLHLLQGDSLKINSLFYRIDLSEKKQIPGGDIQALAMMILRREAQKVWIRANYSAPQS
jgi:hypothetical protein